MRAFFVRLALGLALTCAGAAPGLGAPGDPFGSDDNGCVPQDKGRLRCGVQAAKSVEKLRRSVMRCHADQADARFAEVIAGEAQPFDEEACEGRAAAKLEHKLIKLSETSGCVGSGVLRRNRRLRIDPERGRRHGRCSRCAARHFVLRRHQRRRDRSRRR